MRTLLTRIVRDDRGGEAIDVVVVLGLRVIGALLLIGSLGNKIADRWKAILDFV
jgi:Flp pilus assembly pilin Flp